jgi:aspartate racemase
MKTLGLIGGMSWESSAEYYRIINQEVQQRLGGVHSAQCLMYSFDFAEIEALQAAGAWSTSEQRMAQVARQLQQGGAQGVILCTNTMHKVAAAITQAIDLPFIHIADPTAQRLQRDGAKRVGLLGTRFTMEQDFYVGRLREHFGLDVCVPNEAGRAVVHQVIYEELVRGIVRPQSREQYRAVIADLVSDGVQGVILGCTEIMLLVQAEDSAVPLYDTTTLHALAAVDWMLG